VLAPGADYRRLDVPELEAMVGAGVYYGAAVIKVGLVALDSTGMQADASPGANRSGDWIRGEVEKKINEARATDDEEDRRSGPSTGDDLPDELLDPDSRLARLLAAKARLDDDAATRQADYEAKLRAREEHKKRTGKGMRDASQSLPRSA